jgi:hypothetical protein
VPLKAPRLSVYHLMAVSRLPLLLALQFSQDQGFHLLFLPRPRIEFVIVGIPNALHWTTLHGSDRARGALFRGRIEGRM